MGFVIVGLIFRDGIVDTKIGLGSLELKGGMFSGVQRGSRVDSGLEPWIWEVSG